MINNFAVISGNNVLFAHDLVRPNGFVVKVPVDYYYSEWGFLIPLEVNGLNVLEYLKGDRDLELSEEAVIKAYLLKHDGVLEEWSHARNKSVTMVRRVSPWGPGVSAVRSNCMEVEESFIAAMDATNDNLEKSLALVQQTLRNTAARMTILHIPDIIEELNKRFPLDSKKRQVRGTLPER